MAADALSSYPVGSDTKWREKVLSVIKCGENVCEFGDDDRDVPDEP